MKEPSSGISEGLPEINSSTKFSSLSVFLSLVEAKVFDNWHSEKNTVAQALAAALLK